MARSWQLLDRQTEFGAVRSAMADDSTCGAVLVGAAGVGKTTLARAVTKSLDADVRWVACTESSRSIPLGVFAHWIQASGSRDPTALIAAARESIVSTANPIIGIDDAHLLDDLSATLLHQIAVDHVGHVVATVRSGEPVPDAVTALWKDNYLQRFELDPLTQRQSIALVEKVLGGPLEGLSADVMWRSSRGNPLFLRHLVEGSMQAGSLTEVNGVWQLRGDAVVPSGLDTLIGDRLEHVDDTVFSALKVLSMCEPLDIDTLCEIASDEAVDAAEIADLIRVERDGVRTVVRFSHPMFGEAVRRRVGTASGRRLRGKLVRVLRDRDLGTASNRIRLARLSIDCDEPVDVDLLVTAAKDAVYLSNLPLGEELARARPWTGAGAYRLPPCCLARCCGRDAPNRPRKYWLPSTPTILTSYPWCCGAFPVSPSHSGRWGRTSVRTSCWRCCMSACGHHILKPVVDATDAAIALHENRFDEGLARAHAVLSDPVAPKQAVEFAAFGVGLTLPVAGRGHEFEPIAQRCRDDKKRTTDGLIAAMVRYCDVLALTYTGQLDLAEERVAEYTKFSSAGQFLAWAIARIMAGVVATQRGLFREAIEAFEQALAAQRADRPLPWQLPARLLLARAYAALGRAVDGERVLDEAREHSGPHVAIHMPQMMLAKAWLVAARGSDRGAVDAARRAADAAHSAGQYALEAEALHHAARFGDRTVGRRIESLCTRVHGPLTGLYARHALAVAHSDITGLEAVSADFEAAGLLLSAADAAAQAVALRMRAGDRGKGSDAAARVLRMADRCGGVVTPAILAAAKPLPISSREREIAVLIGEGLSDKDIATRLQLSVRTVEGHIYRARMKLDADDREEFAKIVGSDLKPPEAS
ncbi:bacterial regulatory s, luxR family protein [Mycobacteroides abscessus 1948]|uniref:Bacterial regulatory s, luxR family protein n=1 Tax=Mycobacteroides abscessus 1948 TaxID=1299323 RepID=A0A829QIF2_9MYCO|nr:bacterial regulatory s, luxR family protein [Mycobacteroides abscessus 1948]